MGGWRERDHVEESPSLADTHMSTTRASRTAPPGWEFYCPSKNCKRHYKRQGDLENHLQHYHAEMDIELPLRNPQLYLGRVFQEDPSSLPAQEDCPLPNPADPLTPAPRSSEADNYASDALSADTVLTDVIGAVGQDIPPSVQHVIDDPSKHSVSEIQQHIPASITGSRIALSVATRAYSPPRVFRRGIRKLSHIVPLCKEPRCSREDLRRSNIRMAIAETQQSICRSAHQQHPSLWSWLNISYRDTRYVIDDCAL